ncbi:MAG: CoA-binding protein [Syntrophaceae bacterium]|nr:CoA-binding protein [Syntrophaceae bacterium]
MEKAEHFLEHFFNPKSIAIVGATNNPLKMNFRIMQNLINLDFQGPVYPVNPREEKILGIRAFASLRDILEPVDLVVSAVPASKTMEIVRDCDEIGVKHLVIITGGFSEGGEEGQKLHEEIAAFIKEKGIRVLGPNTLSPINTRNRLAISFNPIKKMRNGGISFAFQSGFYEPKINWILSHMGINKILDMGNKMDIHEVDTLRYLYNDPDTKVIAMHIESLKGNGRDFFSLLKSASKEKPTIILKAGKTPAGSRAAVSHTGSLSRENDVIFDSMIKQASAIRAQNLDDFFDLAKAFEFLPLPHGNRLAIITLSGGEGVMATDACELNGLKLASLSNDTYQKINKIFPPWEIPLNPFDAGVCMEFHLSDLFLFFQTLTAIPQDENVDATIMQMPPQNLFDMFLRSPNGPQDMMASLKEHFVQWLISVKGYGKPFALWCTAMDSREMELVERLEAGSVPVFHSSERAIKALSAMWQYAYRTRQGRSQIR